MVAVREHIFKGRGAAAQWHSTIEDLFGAGENCIGIDHQFSGDIRHGALGQIEISKVTSSHEVSRRTRAHVGKDTRDTYVLVRGISGDISLQQGAARMQIVPQSFVFYCASRPYEWQHMNMTEVRNIAVPGSSLRARLRNVDQFAGRSFPDTVGMWRILADVMDTSLAELKAIPEAASHQLGAQIVDLLAITLEGDGRLSLNEASSRSGLYRRCRGFIRGNIANEDLGPDMIASAVGVSIRSLHRIFAENGPSVLECIREERLAAALTHLQNPGNAEISISEIAHRTGFRSHSHFSHAFRTKFGMSPTDWRRTELSRSPQGGTAAAVQDDFFCAR